MSSPAKREAVIKSRSDSKYLWWVLGVHVIIEVLLWVMYLGVTLDGPDDTNNGSFKASPNLLLGGSVTSLGLAVLFGVGLLILGVSLEYDELLTSTKRGAMLAKKYSSFSPCFTYVAMIFFFELAQVTTIGIYYHNYGNLTPTFTSNPYEWEHYINIGNRGLLTSSFAIGIFIWVTAHTYAHKHMAAISGILKLSNQVGKMEFPKGEDIANLSTTVKSKNFGAKTYV